MSGNWLTGGARSSYRRRLWPRWLAAATFATILVGLPAQATAQATAIGSVFGGIGAGLCGGCGAEGILHLGGGGDVLITDHVAAGADVGFIGPLDYLDAGIGLATFAGSYRFGQRTSRVRPFVAGGYSLLFRDGSLSAISFGGGVDYWMSGRLGMRFEVLDHLPAFSDDGLDAHFVDVRVGIIFR